MHSHLHHDDRDRFEGGADRLMYGAALELVAGQVVAPSTTQTALTLGAGNSLTIRNAPYESQARLIQAWTDVQAAGILRIRSPRMHDNVQGIRARTVVSEAKPLLPWGVAEPLTPQDTLTVDLSGSAVAGDVEGAALLIYYPDLPGIEGQFITPDELAQRAVHTVTVENTLALGTAGGYSGEEAINAEFDLLKANTDYALVGYLVDGECLAVRWRGADTGNLGVGGPGDDSARELTSSWFVRLSREYGIAGIPVFNSANKAGILLDGMQDENGLDVAVTSILVELS